jgi:hypothetical protein
MRRARRPSAQRSRGWACLSPAERNVRGQSHRKVAVRHGDGATARAVDDRDRRTPVPARRSRGYHRHALRPTAAVRPANHAGGTWWPPRSPAGPALRAASRVSRAAPPRVRTAARFRASAAVRPVNVPLSTTTSPSPTTTRTGSPAATPSARWPSEPLGGPHRAGPRRPCRAHRVRARPSRRPPRRSRARTTPRTRTRWWHAGISRYAARARRFAHRSPLTGLTANTPSGAPAGSLVAPFADTDPCAGAQRSATDATQQRSGAACCSARLPWPAPTPALRAPARSARGPPRSTSGRAGGAATTPHRSRRTRCRRG